MIYIYIYICTCIYKAGDCAVVSFRADDPDDFGLLLLADFGPGAKLYVTDNGVLSSGALRRTEGIRSSQHVDVRH